MAEQILTVSGASWTKALDGAGEKTGRAYLVETPTKWSRATFRRRLAAAGAVEVDPRDLERRLVEGVKALLAGPENAADREQALGALERHRRVATQWLLLREVEAPLEARAAEIGAKAVEAAVDAALAAGAGLPDDEARLLHWQKAAHAGDLGAFRLAVAGTAVALNEAHFERERVARAVRRGWAPYAEACADADYFDEVFALEAARAFVAGWRGDGPDNGGLPAFRRNLDGTLPAELVDQIPDEDLAHLRGELRARLALGEVAAKKSASPPIGRSGPTASIASAEPAAERAASGGSAAASGSTRSRARKSSHKPAAASKTKAATRRRSGRGKTGDGS